MFCIKCGQQLAEDAKLCIKCGNKIEAPGALAPAYESSAAPVAEPISHTTELPTPTPMQANQTEETSQPKPRHYLALACAFAWLPLIIIIGSANNALHRSTGSMIPALIQNGISIAMLFLTVYGIKLAKQNKETHRTKAASVGGIIGVVLLIVSIGMMGMSRAPEIFSDADSPNVPAVALQTELPTADTGQDNNIQDNLAEEEWVTISGGGTSINIPSTWSGSWSGDYSNAGNSIQVTSGDGVISMGTWLPRADIYEDVELGRVTYPVFYFYDGEGFIIEREDAISFYHPNFIVITLSHGGDRSIFTDNEHLILQVVRTLTSATTASEPHAPITMEAGLIGRWAIENHTTDGTPWDPNTVVEFFADGTGLENSIDPFTWRIEGITIGMFHERLQFEEWYLVGISENQLSLTEEGAFSVSFTRMNVQADAP